MNLANKYRPTRLENVIGQDAAVATIRGVLKRREEVNPVTLFCGPHSTGKTTLAWILALYANCKDPTDNGDACRTCDSCANIIRAIREGRNAQAVLEKPVSERGIDAIRALESQARYKTPHRYWWFILDEVHNLTRPAFDAALRLFEKPPAQARFILCTTEPYSLPRTILSRNFIFNLKAIDPEVTARDLLLPINKREKFKLSEEAVLAIAEKVHGYPRDALNLMTQYVAAAEGGATPEDQARVLESLAAAAPYEAIQRHCRAIIQGKMSTAIYTLQYANNPEYFVGQILVYLQQVLYRWVSAERLADPRYDVAMEVIQPPDQKRGRKLIGDLGLVLQTYLDAQDRIKQYRCDNQAVLEAAAIEAVGLTRGWGSE